jgi:hypothetical protein
MRQNDGLVSGLRLLPLFGAGLVASLLGRTVFGHTLLLSQANAVIDENSVSIELEVSTEDFVHWYGLPGNPDSRFSAQSVRDIAERHAMALHQILNVRDAAGKRLPSEDVRIHFDVPATSSLTINDLRDLRAAYTTKFSYPSEPRFLTFQLLMDGDYPSVFWQVVLGVHSPGKNQGRTIRLTSRGNAETVEFIWNDGRANVVSGEIPTVFSPSCGVEGATSLSEPCVNIDFGMKSIDVQITMPLALLQTWLALTAGDDEFLAPDEQESARTAIEQLLIPALSVESDERRHVAVVANISFLSIDEKETDPHAEKKSYSLLTGRLVARLRFEMPNALKQADLHWNLFNNVVLSATAVISGNGPTVLHEFSTYQPNYHWQRGL